MKQHGQKGRGRGGNRDKGGFKDGGAGQAKPGRGAPKRGEKSAERGRERPARAEGRSFERPAERDRREGGAELRGGRGNLWGVHAVQEAWLNPARRIRGLYVTAEALAEFADIIEQARGMGLERPAPTLVERRQLDRLTGGTGAVHQGIVLDAAPLEDVSVQDLINKAAARERAVIVMLDQVTDPHNVGAIMRSACAFDAVGIVMQKRHAPELDGVLVKTASGAAEHIDVAYETNLSRTLEQLQEAGFFAIALDERGEASLEELPAYERAVIVMGAEGPGIRRLVKEHCDRLVRLPTAGKVGVLNVSNATAVALYALCTAK